MTLRLQNTTEQVGSTCDPPGYISYLAFDSIRKISRLRMEICLKFDDFEAISINLLITDDVRYGYMFYVLSMRI